MALSLTLPLPGLTLPLPGRHHVFSWQASCVFLAGIMYLPIVPILIVLLLSSAWLYTAVEFLSQAEFSPSLGSRSLTRKSKCSSANVSLTLP